MSNTNADVAEEYFHAMSSFIILLNHVLMNLLDSLTIFPYFCYGCCWPKCLIVFICMTNLL